MGGRKPKPANIKAFEGFRGHRTKKEKARRVDLPEAELLPPDYFTEQQVKEWYLVRSALDPAKVLTEADRHALECYVTVYAQWREAVQNCHPLIDEDGRSNPWFGIAEKTFKMMRPMMVELGLTPAARAKFSGNDGKTVDDEMDEILSLARNG